MTGLSDSFQRPVNYLRISVTDRCNLRCTYCMPETGISLLPRREVLSFEEILAITGAAAELGVTKVRITGGEPLARAGVVSLVEMISRIKGIDDLSLTTNGILLKKHAIELKQAGLNRVNVSLDSLRPERFRVITRVGELADVLEGIEAAKSAGLNPVKVNVVVMRGVNDDEIPDFARKTIDDDWNVRFIELMPFGQADAEKRFVPVSEMKERLARLGNLEPCHGAEGNGPARYFRLPNSRGTLGFISPVSEHFCIGCNRLRLTADGKLKPCLLSDQEIDLKTAIRGGASHQDIKALLEQAVAAKPRKHHLDDSSSSAVKRRMAQIGG